MDSAAAREQIAMEPPRDDHLRVIFFDPRWWYLAVAPWQLTHEQPLENVQKKIFEAETESVEYIVTFNLI